MWVQIVGFPAWPAIVVPIPFYDRVTPKVFKERKSDQDLLVYFYGSYQLLSLYSFSLSLFDACIVILLGFLFACALLVEISRLNFYSEIATLSTHTIAR